MIASEARIATTDAEREAIYRLRYEVFAQELNIDLPADHERRLMPDPPDERPMQLYIEDEHGIAGTVNLHFGADAPFSPRLVESYSLEPFRRVLSDRQMAIGERLAIRPSLRGTSAWHTLLWAIATNQLGRGLEVTFVNCELHMVNFYLRLGYRPYKPALEPFVGSVRIFPLVFIGGDFDYLRRIESPLFGVFGETMGTPAIAERLVPLLDKTPIVSAGGSVSDTYLGLVETMLAAVPERRDLFVGLAREEVRSLLVGSHVVDFPQGTWLIADDKFARSVFVLLEGECDVVDQGVRTIAHVTTGEVLGEVAFLLETRRSAGVKVTSPNARVLCLSEKPLKGLIDANPRAAATLWQNLAKTLAGRLVSTNRLLR